MRLRCEPGRVISSVASVPGLVIRRRYWMSDVRVFGAAPHSAVMWLEPESRWRRSTLLSGLNGSVAKGVGCCSALGIHPPSGAFTWFLERYATTQLNLSPGFNGSPWNVSTTYVDRSPPSTTDSSVRTRPAPGFWMVTRYCTSAGRMSGTWFHDTPMWRKPRSCWRTDGTNSGATNGLPPSRKDGIG